MAGFVLTSALAQRASSEVASLSETIASTSSPSIERLAHLRSLVFEVELNLSEHLRRGLAGERERRAFETSLDSLERATKSYLVLPLLPGEQPYWGETQAALIRFESSVRSSAELARAGDVPEGHREFSTMVRQAGEQLVVSSLKGIEYHAQNSRAMATRIKEARQRARLLANALSGICVVLGIAGLLLIRRQTRRHRALVEAHSRFHEARADELEQFAGRVAHDIRGPLSVAVMAAHLGLCRVGDNEPKDLLTRIARALARADAITTGLLEFARCGAQPEPGARAIPSELLDDLVRGMLPDAEQRGIEIVLQAVPPVMVRAVPGVYMSLTGNLVRNAIKYIGVRATRRVSVRVTEEGTVVRTEVTDTGPGIASENLGSLFEPYFRVGADRGKEGLGLGLATVKKLVEGHHGAVGVTSEPGKGSTFWFTLPRAEFVHPSRDIDAGSTEPATHAGPNETEGHH
jgi:signal transduction histidine kinase